MPGSSGFNGSNLLIDVSPSGYGVVAWTEGNRPSISIRASTRASATAAWGKPTTLQTTSNANDADVISIAINPANQAVAAWRVQNATDYTRSLWVSSLRR